MPRPPHTSPPAHRIAAVVLAAGQARRMGGENKLLAVVDGVPMIERVVDTVCGSRAHPVVVVTGFDATRVEAALREKDVRLVRNDGYELGMSTSIRTGLRALTSDILHGVLICLGDMPWVRARDIDALIEAFDPERGRGICVPVHAGTAGNPVLWSLEYLDDLLTVDGDRGAKYLLTKHATEVHEVLAVGPGVLQDVDLPRDLER